MVVLMAMVDMDMGAMAMEAMADMDTTLVRDLLNLPLML